MTDTLPAFFFHSGTQDDAESTTGFLAEEGRRPRGGGAASTALLPKRRHDVVASSAGTFRSPVATALLASRARQMGVRRPTSSSGARDGLPFQLPLWAAFSEE